MEKRVFQLRFRASELLDVREGSLPIIDIARRHKTVFLFYRRLRKKKELLVFVLKSAAYSSGGCRTTTCSPFFFR